jgi:hypothetical protein
MPRDYDQTAKALIAGAEKAVEKAVAPLLREIEDLKRTVAELEKRQPEKGDQGERGMPGESGRDGTGLAGAIIDRSGSLILTMTDGTTRDLGPVIGKDGEPGEKGEKGDPGADGKDGRDGIDGKDGEPGRDGTDGKDAYPGEVKGVFSADEDYRARDIVMFDGSSWIARRDGPGSIPGDGWMQLACKGKRGDRGERGERGLEGKAGKDGVMPIQIFYDVEEMKQITTLDNGEVLEADIEPLARMIRGE